MVQRVLPLEQDESARCNGRTADVHIYMHIYMHIYI